MVPIFFSDNFSFPFIVILCQTTYVRLASPSALARPFCGLAVLQGVNLTDKYKTDPRQQRNCRSDHSSRLPNKQKATETMWDSGRRVFTDPLLIAQFANKDWYQFS